MEVALACARGTFQGSIRLRHGCVTALACARGRNARAVTFFCSPVTASRARARCVKRIAQPECASLAHARVLLPEFSSLKSRPAPAAPRRPNRNNNPQGQENCRSRRLHDPVQGYPSGVPFARSGGLVIVLHGCRLTLEPVAPLKQHHHVSRDARSAVSSSTPLIAGPRSTAASQVLAFQA